LDKTYFFKVIASDTIGTASQTMKVSFPSNTTDCTINPFPKFLPNIEIGTMEASPSYLAVGGMTKDPDLLQKSSNT
jgi:hypothetical protein